MRLGWSQCRSPRVSKGETRTLEVSPLLTRGLPHPEPPFRERMTPCRERRRPRLQASVWTLTASRTNSSSGILSSVTPEEPALQARAPALQSYKIIGEPEDLDGARQLASEDRYQFQWWALSLIKARPLGGSAGSKEGKKG